MRRFLLTLLGMLLLLRGVGILPAKALTVTILARGFGHPDDLAWGPHGAIYFSDLGNGAINLLDPTGRRSILFAGLSGPEGIVVEPDGSLIVAEQNRNRLLRVDPRRHTAHVLAVIPNPTGGLGIDGIARDPRDGSLIVPDSPGGRVLRLGADGHLTAVLATGLGRPVGALVQPGGGIVVVDEHRNGAFRIGPRGGVRLVGGFLSVPDDLVDDGHGGFYVTCLGDNTLRHVDARGVSTLVAAGLANPQGLLRGPGGSLIVAEEDANLLVSLQPR